MKTNVKAVLTGAVVSGLLLGGAAFADQHSKPAATGDEVQGGKDGCSGKADETKTDKDSCKGKDGCANKDAKKKKKGDKDACSGKEGCGSKK